MASRISEAQGPYYPDARPNSFQVGLEFQDYVCVLLAQDHIILQNLGSKLYQLQVGENLQGFEIKYDERCTDTGRLSIEIAEKSRNDPNLPWTPSGIMRDDNAWLYIQGNHEIIFVFAKNYLRRYFELKSPKVHENFGTVRKFYISLDNARVMAARVIETQGEITKNSAHE